MLKRRKKPTEHRQGTLVRFVDAIQRLYKIRHEEDFIVFDGDMMSSGHVNQKYQDEIDDILLELNTFDITEIGNLYLTSGGRVVLDKGYGEYFNEGDKVLFTLDELIHGMRYEDFLEKLKNGGKK
jgi:hypothetical protein